MVNNAAAPHTLIRVEGRAGRITLNRPEALNALRYEQIGEIQLALDTWRDDPEIALIILDGAGERGLCAGGDIRQLYDAREDDPSLASRFWRDEYHLNADIHRYPKPFVAIMDGIVMGGGIGLSAHASHRIVTASSQLAMPETSIGLVPDVGGTYLLANAPGRLGTFLGLTGTRMGAADAIFAGFADTHVAQADLEPLITELSDPHGDPVGVTIAEHASAPPPAMLAGRQSEIDHLCSGKTLADIRHDLGASEAPDWAQTAAADLDKRSPLAMAWFLEAVRLARHYPDLETALRTEFRLVNRLYDSGELIEGTRALIIDKDRQPRWLVPTISDLTEDHIAQGFTPLETHAELDLLRT